MNVSESDIIMYSNLVVDVIQNIAYLIKLSEYQDLIGLKQYYIRINEIKDCKDFF